MRRLLAPVGVTVGLVIGLYIARSIPIEPVPWPVVERLSIGHLLESAILLSLAWLAKRGIEAVFRRARPGSDEERVPSLAFDILGVLLFLAAIIAIVGLVFGQPVTGLLATSGILTGVIAFAVRDLIADIFAGVAIAIERPIRVGDWIQFDEGTPAKTGRVVEMNWRAVRMVTVQGRTIIWPNNAISRREFVNLSLPERYFRTVKEIVVDFRVPAERAADIIMSAIRATPGVVLSQKPLVLIEELGERGIRFSFHFWVPDYPEMFMIERRVVENALHYLDQAGYAPAYPKLEADIAWHHVSEIDPSMDLPDLLHRVSLFKELSEDERERLAREGREVTARAGETLVEEGAEGDSLFVILAGLAVAYREIDGDLERIGIIQPGQVFGEMSLLTGEPRSATVIAEIDCVLLEIEREVIQGIVADNPDIVEQLGRIQAARIEAGEMHAAGAEADALESTGLTASLIRRIWLVFGRAES